MLESLKPAEVFAGEIPVIFVVSVAICALKRKHTRDNSANGPNTVSSIMWDLLKDDGTGDKSHLLR